MKKLVVLCSICFCAFPAFAQGSVAGKVARAVARKKPVVPQVKMVQMPQVRPLALTEDDAVPYLFMADNLYEKAAFAKRFTPQYNLMQLGVRGPVMAMERFTKENVAFNDPKNPEEFLFDVETMPRYRFDGARDALAGWENAAILSRSKQNKVLRGQLKEWGHDILNYLSQGKMSVGMHGVFNTLAAQTPELDVIAIGQLPYFRAGEVLGTEMETFIRRIREYAPTRPMVLITPFLQKGVVMTSADNKLSPMESSAPVHQAVSFLLAAVENNITVVGTGLFSRAAETDYVFYEGDSKSLPGFEDTAMGQLEQQNFLTDVLQKYREENPTALVIVWAPTEFVAYNGFNSVTAGLKKADQKIKVVQITGTDNAVTRFEMLLPKSVREEFATYPGLIWPEEAAMWHLSGADAFIRVVGLVQP